MSFVKTAEFRRLTELQLHGGSWHGSQLDQLISKVGPGLRHLGQIFILTLGPWILYSTVGSPCSHIGHIYGSVLTTQALKGSCISLYNLVLYSVT